MKLITTPIDNLFILNPIVFEDSRGWFFESFNSEKFNKLIGGEISFVQDNMSFSKKGVVRALHLQLPPFTQGKLVSVIAGRVLDVAVDLRKNSTTFGKHFSIELSAENKLMLWIPEGFAHGFSALEDNTIFNYKCTNFYDKDSERSILWNDADLNIDWKINNPILSEKDMMAQPFKEFKSPF